LGRRNDRVALATKSCKDCRRGWVVFLIGEKMVSLDFGGAARPRLQTPGAGARLDRLTTAPAADTWH